MLWLKGPAGPHKGSLLGKKSIFSANHSLIIAYGQTGLLLASINLVWPVVAAYKDADHSYRNETTDDRSHFTVPIDSPSSSLSSQWSFKMGGQTPNSPIRALLRLDDL